MIYIKCLFFFPVALGATGLLIGLIWGIFNAWNENFFDTQDKFLLLSISIFTIPFMVCGCIFLWIAPFFKALWQ